MLSCQSWKSTWILNFHILKFIIKAKLTYKKLAMIFNIQTYKVSNLTNLVSDYLILNSYTILGLLI
jgi:hypothetical protein